MVQRTSGGRPGSEEALPLVEPARTVNGRNPAIPRPLASVAARAMAYAMHRFAIAIPGLLVLSACAANTVDYPSLSRRPAERVSGTAQPAPAQTVPAPEMPDAQATSRIGALVTRAQASDARFASLESDARRAVTLAGNAATDSREWSNATVALASLASARSDTVTALADLDALYVDARLAGRTGAEIDVARSTVRDIAARQDAVLNTLEESLAAPNSSASQSIDEVVRAQPPSGPAPAP